MSLGIRVEGSIFCVEEFKTRREIDIDGHA